MARIREFCENNENWAIYLPDDWTGADIEQLYRRHVDIPEPYTAYVGEIANDARTPRHILVEIKNRFADLPEVASGLALNPQTPLEFVEELTRHANDDVREHALQSLQRRKGPSL